MKPFKFLATLVLMLILAACGGASPMSQTAGEAAPPQVAPAQPPGGASSLDGGNARAGVEKDQGAPPAAPGVASPQEQQQRMVIKTAEISLQVEKVRDAEAAIRDKVAQLGGYVVTSENQGADEYMTTRIVFRVPAQRFDEALAGVQGLAKKVLGRTITGDDVTEEFVDLESRVRNLEASRDRLLNLLQKADKVEDALNINNALTDIQGQIEQARGRMQYLKQSATLSTISVTLNPVPPTPVIVEEGSWQPVRVARSALREMIEFLQGLTNVAIVLLIWTPLWLPLVGLGIWMRRRLRRRASITVPTPAASSKAAVEPVTPDSGSAEKSK